MLCEKCEEREATVHLTQVVDGAVEKLHLCEECAAKSGFDLEGPVSITDILLGMGGQEKPQEMAKPESDRVCLSCGLTRAEFKKRGRLGCPACYEAFAADLGPLLKAMHRSEQHIGKVPSKESVRVQITAQIAGLQKALDRAVLQEQFEEAARLRDEIQACRKRAVEEKQ